MDGKWLAEPTLINKWNFNNFYSFNNQFFLNFNNGDWSSVPTKNGKSYATSSIVLNKNESLNEERYAICHTMFPLQNASARQ